LVAIFSRSRLQSKEAGLPKRQSNPCRPWDYRKHPFGGRDHVMLTWPLSPRHGPSWGCRHDSESAQFAVTDSRRGVVPRHVPSRGLTTHHRKNQHVRVHGDLHAVILKLTLIKWGNLMDPWGPVVSSCKHCKEHSGPIKGGIFLTREMTICCSTTLLLEMDFAS
jgi:hypothetical protein